MTRKHRTLKILAIISGIILILVILLFVFISPITKYLVEKYDQKYTGREITMDWAYVNPFTGYVSFHNFKIYEQKNINIFPDSISMEISGDSVFLSAESVSADFALMKLFSKTYEISEITLNKPQGYIIQNYKNFNFDDLIAKFSPEDSTDTLKPPVHFNILGISINNGTFYYREEITPINYFIKNVNIQSSGKYWDSDTMNIEMAFEAGMGSGNVTGNIILNTSNLDYKLALRVYKFDLQIINQYLKEMANQGSFSAFLNANIKAKGNFLVAENLTTEGKIAISDFHFGKTKGDDFASFDNAYLDIIELSPVNHIYYCDTVLLTHPYFKYERYDYLDNLQLMFGEDGANIKATNENTEKFNLVIEIANYLKLLSRNFFQSNYRVNRLSVDNADLVYNDYALSEKFSAQLYPLTIISDSIDNKHKRVNISLRSGILPYGYATVSLSINPKDSGDFDIQYHLQKLPIAMLNPYLVTYTSYPFDRGFIDFEGVWNVRNGVIQSKNHLVIIDPRLNRKLKNKDAAWVPMPLIMSFVRERGNVIDYEIPITGNLKETKFHLKDVFLDLLKNIFVKPVTLPFRMEVRNMETEIEKALSVKWRIMNSSLLMVQEKFIKEMVAFLKENPTAIIAILPNEYEAKEKEYILFFEAKKKYFLDTHNKSANDFSKSDSLKTIKMSVKDSLFGVYLTSHSNGKIVSTIQDKCAFVVSSAQVDAHFKKLTEERKNTFMSFFIKKGVEKQVLFEGSKTVIPYNGFSFYKISYQGEYPEPLTEAYEKMNDINKKAYRKKFYQDRDRNKKTF